MNERHTAWLWRIQNRPDLSYRAYPEPRYRFDAPHGEFATLYACASQLGTFAEVYGERARRLGEREGGRYLLHLGPRAPAPAPGDVYFSNYYNNTTGLLDRLQKVDGDISGDQKALQKAMATVSVVDPNGYRLKLDNHRQAIGDTFGAQHGQNRK